MSDAQKPEVLPAGTQAPSFNLKVTPDQKLALSEFAGRRLIMAFYPADWSPVCSDQMSLYNHLLDEFRQRGAELVGISVDSAWCHQAFGKDRNLHFPLLADFEPKGEVSKAYGAYMYDDGESARALFVIDEKGVVAWSHLSPLGINPGADGILDALDAMPPLEKSNVLAASAG
jgi:peroxiredoxin